MKLTDIVQAVLTTTKRQDQADNIKRAVRSAIKQAHEAAWFPKDVVENPLELSQAETRFKFNIPARMRKIVEIAPRTEAGDLVTISTENNTYTNVGASAATDSFNNAKPDICYLAGSTITVSSSVPVQYLHMSYYESPEVSDDNLETWIMADYEDLIIDWATAIFYRRMGNRELATPLMNEVLEVQLSSLINNHAEA